MPNNRLYIQIKDNPATRIILAKYYPNTGWYCYHSQETIDEWFDMFVNEDKSMLGATNLELAYETMSNDKKDV